MLDNLILGLAIYRLARLITKDSLPFNIMGKLREYWGKRASESQYNGISWTIAEYLHCPYCTGFVLAILFVLVDIPETILLILAIAGIQDLLQSLSER